MTALCVSLSPLCTLHFELVTALCEKSLARDKTEKPCRFVPVFCIGKDGKSVPTITPTYGREIYYTRQPQLLEIKKAMTQMVLRLSGEVPIAVDLS